MSTPLRVLLVEDVELDALLVVRELTRGGYDVAFERVDTAEGLSAALAQELPWDLILSDYAMPRFSAPLALGLVRSLGTDVPFILVSGIASEDIAVEMLHAGAQDFMSKSRLGRLVPAIERELANVALRAERKKMGEQLMISDRMASMGTLAAGVAHEISNPLACIVANLELVATDLRQRSEKLGMASEFLELRDELHDAQEATDRIRNILRDLKLFSRAEAERTGPVDVEQVLESTLRMAWNEIRHRARLVKSYGHMPLAQASESRLGQVFLNLVVNAAQAIPEGRAAQNEIRVSTKTDRRGAVLIEIADTGSGMAPDVLKQLFTPFFTTKAVGLGTGLGLSICQRIITGFGGSIDVKSVVGKGTTFRISLPPATAAVRESVPISMPLGIACRRGRILVVDDEPMIAKVVQRILGTEHEVFTVTSAEEALTLIVSGERFDVVLCDLMMPQMTGMDLHAELSRAFPDSAAKMVFLTGGAFTTRARDFLDSTPHPRVEKPFNSGQLRALVNGLIC